MFEVSCGFALLKASIFRWYGVHCRCRSLLSVVAQISLAFVEAMKFDWLETCLQFRLLSHSVKLLWRWGLCPVGLLYTSFRFNGCNGPGYEVWRRQSLSLKLNDGIVGWFLCLVPLGYVDLGLYVCACDFWSGECSVGIPKAV